MTQVCNIIFIATTFHIDNINKQYDAIKCEIISLLMAKMKKKIYVFAQFCIQLRPLLLLFLCPFSPVRAVRLSMCTRKLSVSFGLCRRLCGLAYGANFES